jgi:hypothetical protein
MERTADVLMAAKHGMDGPHQFVKQFCRFLRPG